MKTISPEMKEAALGQPEAMEVDVNAIRQWLVEQMAERHRTVADIAHEYGYSRPTVSLFLKSQLPEEMAVRVAAKIKEYKEFLEEVMAEEEAASKDNEQLECLKAIAKDVADIKALILGFYKS